MPSANSPRLQRADEAIAPALLSWYDTHARNLPWRVSPGERRAGRRIDPWRVLVSEFMLQQTTAGTVARRYAAFVGRWPTAEALAAAPLDDVLSAWAGLGYYARARNLHRAAQAIAARPRAGAPRTEDELRLLPGVGAYTAAAVAAIAFDAPCVPVDGNVERVTARLFAVDGPLPGAKPRLRDLAQSLRPSRRTGDFAQALMDLGALVCTPKSPNCSQCPISFACLGYGSGAPARFPRRAAKSQRPVRYGAALAQFNRRGQVLLERRPESGLLGGTLGLPGTAWTNEIPQAEQGIGRARPAGRVAHVFTHFRLELDVFVDAAPRRRLRPCETWADPRAVALPTVMRKALDLALARRLNPATNR
jgi:A/G-specific adenine glycosylase